MKRIAPLVFAALLAAAGAVCAQTPAPHDIEDFIRKPKFNDVKISPTGEFLAATVPVGRKTALVILRRSDNKVVANMTLPGDYIHVADFWWVNNERVLLSAAEKIGDQEEPELTGELFAINADGSRGEMLVGQGLLVDRTGTRVQPKKEEQVAADLVDDLRADDKNVIISVRPFSGDPFVRVERMDVYTGRRMPISQAPIRNADYVTDNAGNVRFAYGEDTDLSQRVYYREIDGKEWKLINDDKASGSAHLPLGFSTDDKLAYFRVEMAEGPDAIVSWDPATGERKEVFRDDDADPRALFLNGVPVGVEVMDGLPRKVYFDPQSKMARLYAKLDRAFAGERVFITSMTADAGVALVYTESDRNPGDFFLFDAVANKADRLLSVKEWIDPARGAETRPVTFKARDGLTLHGYLTAPVGGVARNAPTIVYIHGGPYNVRDVWNYDREVQILAAHGYAVLQVNFRGSGGRGRSFVAAGRREWGGKMQDDITDATRWAIEQGIADPQRICLYGASYGGYASLMGAVREPTLYRCVAGYVGVYDLPTMHTDGDIRDRASGKTYLEEWIGSREDVARVSPNRLADRINVPVFLAGGGEDDRAPIQHTEMMEKALRAAGKTVEAHYYPTEGHGFYKPENERDYYGKLLNFFRNHLGGRAPVVTAAPAKK